MRRSSVLTLMLFVTLAASPQEKHTENTVRRAADAPIPAAKLEELAWLAGRWQGEGLGGRIEETWSAPDGGAIMGMFRLIRDDATAFYEFILIRPTERGLAMQLKHFHPDLKGWEEKDESVEFLYVGRRENRYLFERLTYERHGEDKMTVYLALRGEGGSLRELTFQLRRVAKP